MKVYHQVGHNYKWNIDSYNDGCGEGLILSPVNMDSDKLLALPEATRRNSFLDPQMYLLGTERASIGSYPFFPGNIKAGFSTTDLATANTQIAQLCTDYQVQAQMKYVVIPTRYLDATPSKYLEQMTSGFVMPFLDYKEQKGINTPYLLTVVVKQSILTTVELRDELLNWMTGIQGIAGFYLIFDNDFHTKQIKDFDYLRNALFFIHVLKMNSFEVHIGYTNTEGLLFSAAMPDSVSIGAYENLRNFRISRFETPDGKRKQGPNPRLYSTKLLQWMEYTYIQSMEQMVPDYQEYFDDSKYRPLMFEPNYKWHFTKPELYKHYFEVFSQQIGSLPDNQAERIDSIKQQIQAAIAYYREIKQYILLDDDSDDSHLPTWFNALNAYQRSL